jgi:integrase
MTFNEFADYYIQDYAPKKSPKTARGIVANINNHLRPQLGFLKVIEITKEDIRATIDAIVDGKTAKTVKTKKHGKRVVTGGTGAARSTYTHLRHMLMTYAPQKGIATQPHLFILTPKPESRYSKWGRDRFLTEKEYARLGEFIEKCKNRPGIEEVSRQELYEQVWETSMFKLCKRYGISDVSIAKLCRKNNIPTPYVGYWAKKEAGKPVSPKPLPNPENAATEMIEIKNPAFSEYHINPSVIRALELYLYTGCRKREILELKIEDVDFEQNQVLFRKTKTEENLRMPLAKPAMDTIKEFRADRKNNPHRYSYADPDNPYVIPGQGKDHLKGVYHVWTDVRERLGLDDVTIHDIRRSFGSVGARENMSLLMIGKALAHKSIEATRIYARLSDDATEGAVSHISNRVFELVTGAKAEPQKEMSNDDIDMSDIVAASVMKVLETLQEQGGSNDQLMALLGKPNQAA